MDMNIEWDSQYDPDNMISTLEELNRKVDKSLGDRGEVIGIQITRHAKNIVRVDTGKLRASIDYDVNEPKEMVVHVAVGTDVYYSIFVEVDYPFLRPSIDASKSVIRREVIGIVKDLA